jgi:hypothetical protein
MLQCAEQEVAESSTLGIGPADGGFLQHVHEEILCEVLRVLAAVPLAWAAATVNHWVVWNLGRPPAVESSGASTKSNFARKSL